MKTHLRGGGKYGTVCGRNGITVADVSFVTCLDCHRKQHSPEPVNQWPQLEHVAREIADSVVNRVRDDTAAIGDDQEHHAETAHACLEMVVAELCGRLARDEG
jgi:hypothetical protein